MSVGTLAHSEYELIHEPSDSFTLEQYSDLENESRRQWQNRCNLLEIIIRDLQKENLSFKFEKEQQLVQDQLNSQLQTQIDQLNQKIADFDRATAESFQHHMLVMQQKDEQLQRNKGMFKNYLRSGSATETQFSIILKSNCRRWPSRTPRSAKACSS
jgi:hypothetical protein